MDFRNMTQGEKNCIKAVIECIDDGVWITDGEGYVQEANEEALGLQKREDVIGRNMAELVEKGIYKRSVTLDVLKSKEKVSQMQHDENEVLVTGIPHIENGKIEMIVCCERALKELEVMREQMRSKEEKLEQYRSEIDYLRTVILQEEPLVVESEAMKHAVNLAVMAAKYDSKALIEGETGVGKEVIAKIIYRNSKRNKAPFIAVNCSAISESLLESELFGYEKGAFTGASEKGKKGYFEMANRGVLFLDEIGDVSLNFQAKLLRVLQENEIMRVGGNKAIPVDVQVIAASNRNLEEKVEEGSFRADLYYRLNTLPITVPPLRERRQDIVPLVHLFSEKFNNKYDKAKTFAVSGLNVLQQYRWPGNVRELEHLIERLIMTTKDDLITDRHVTAVISEKPSAAGDEISATLKETVERAERDLFERCLRENKGPAEMEKVLDISRATLNRKLLKYGLR